MWKSGLLYPQIIAVIFGILLVNKGLKYDDKIIISIGLLLIIWEGYLVFFEDKSHF